jgi:prevent-host-death family protein
MTVRTCGAEEARSTLPELLQQAHQGSPTLITKHGKPYAALVPATQLVTNAGLSLLSLKGSGKGQWGPSSGEHVATQRDEWR